MNFYATNAANYVMNPKYCFNVYGIWLNCSDFFICDLCIENKCPQCTQCDISCVFWTGSLGLYFPQRVYTESIYVGQSQGSPVLQVHSMRESTTERPYFTLCSLRDTYTSWFHMDEATGVLSMNKTLEWSDFSSIREFNTALFVWKLAHMAVSSV